ncbi:HNH endonuclease, partial [Mycolicibacterium canariasense]
MAVSKRLRFEILRRDNHTCRYCGRRAPEVQLHVDHVVPTTLGGTDDPTNLVAACADCNSGKSATPVDSPTVRDVDSDVVRWRRAIAVAAQESQRDRAETQRLKAWFDTQWKSWSSGGGRDVPRPDSWGASVEQFLNRGLSIDDLTDLIEVAMTSRVSTNDTWKYFCGCSWKRIKKLEDRATELVHEQPPTDPTPLTTRWTQADIDATVANALDIAARYVDPDDIGYVACRHQETGYCPDPGCALQYATAIEWMTMNAVH